MNVIDNKLRQISLFLILISLISQFGCNVTTVEIKNPAGEIIKKCTKNIFSEVEVCTTYFQTNQISTIANYKNGLLNGVYKSFYKNGQIKVSVEYLNAKIWDILECYDINGNKLNCGTIRNGNGILNEYSSNGNLRHSGEIVNGYKNGYWKNYNNAGLRDSTLYINGYTEGDSFIDNTVF